MTPFKKVYKTFLSNITDDMYSFFDNEKDIEEDLCILLEESIPKFEFPKKSLNYDLDEELFSSTLTQEEVNIIAYLMCISWLERKIRDNRVVLMEYGDKDFGMKSQSAHLKSLLDASEHFKVKLHYVQRLYNRRDALGKPNYNGLAGGAISGNS